MHFKFRRGQQISSYKKSNVVVLSILKLHYNMLYYLIHFTMQEKLLLKIQVI